MEARAQIGQSYFRFLPFVPTELICLVLPEILAEKICACYQRNKARDIYDLGVFATRSLDRALIRRLVVLKLWQARDTVRPKELLLCLRILVIPLLSRLHALSGDLTRAKSEVICAVVERTVSAACRIPLFS